MIRVNDFLALLTSQSGKPYHFGAEANPADPSPPAFDCSEIIEWTCARLGVSPTMPDGTWIQVRHCRDTGTLLSIDNAIRTRGALLFRFSSDPFAGERPEQAHVAVSLGDGRTFEARSTQLGIGYFSSADRGWTHAAAIPGIDYTQPVPSADNGAMLGRLLLVGAYFLLKRKR